MGDRPSKWRWLYLVAALVVPFVVEASYIVITRERVPAPDWADWIGWGAALASGLSCVWRLPLPSLPRAFLTCLYCPVMGLLLEGFAFWFVGARYGLYL
jgi:hypothetical protein